MNTVNPSYAIVSSIKNENIQIIIPKSWIVKNNLGNPVIGNSCEWYWPKENGNKKAELYVKVDTTWDKDYGKILDITGNFI